MDDIEQRLHDRWYKLAYGIGGGFGTGFSGKVLESYKQTHRRYHTLDHLDHCFREIDEVREHIKDPDAVDFAVFLHDIFYDPQAKKPGDPTDEELSAQYAEDLLQRMGIICHFARLVATYIRDTRHESYVVHGEAMWVLDADLSILGRPQEEFDRYEEKVRLEYSFVPEEIFRAKRAEILERFLDTSQYPSIYRTGHFGDKYERQARANLARSIERLRA